MARLDQGWNREDIEFDREGRLVIKNPELIREIQTLLEKTGKIEIVTPPHIGPPPPPNMCGCTYTIKHPDDPSELGSQLPEKTV
jgi:hypothetical protein